MNFIDESLFLTTFGREFCAALASDPDFDTMDEPSSHDCYSVYTDTFGTPPTLNGLTALGGDELVLPAQAFNEFFEVSTVKPQTLGRARDAVIRHWQP